MFHIGQLVVCIDDSHNPNRLHLSHDETIPTKGMIYTIRGFLETPSGVGVYLEEIINKPKMYAQGMLEVAFRQERFRPIQKTSIEVFTAILNKTPAMEDA